MKTNSSIARKLFIKTLLPVIFGGLLIMANARQIAAYDNDTHFWLTYYLAVKAGYTPLQATQIASANISVDYDPDTEPVLANFNQWRDLIHPISHVQNVVIKFHALPFKADVNANARLSNNFWWEPTAEVNPFTQNEMDKLVVARKNDFWKHTFTKKINPGVFLHYAQDVYAHKKFKSWLGHAGYNYVDFLSSNPTEAEKMAFNTLKYLIIFRKYNLEDHPFAEKIDNLDINDFVDKNDISPADITDIKETVAEFINDNPTLGDKNFGDYKYRETPLVTTWNNFSPKKKNAHFKLMPFKYIFQLWKIKNEQPVPNSRKARQIVMNRLKLDDEKMPHIWRYDLKNDSRNINDYVEQPKTNRAYIYNKSKDSTKSKYLSKDEAANKTLTKMRLSNLNKSGKTSKPDKKVCLPFALVENSQTDIQPCQ